MDLEKLPASVLALQRRPSVVTDSESSSTVLPPTLDNVHYMSSIEVASNDADLSTLDEPFNQRTAYAAFFAMECLPREIPCDSQSIISSICSKGKEKALPNPRNVDIETGNATSHTSSSTLTESFKKPIQDFFEERTNLELLFLFVISASIIALIGMLAALPSKF